MHPNSGAETMIGTTGSQFLEGDLRIVFPASPQAVRQVLAQVIEKVRHGDLADEELGSIELVLAEVLNNIVEHAYGDSGSGEIEMRLSQVPNGLYCTITDDGVPMPDGMPPLGMAADPTDAIEDLPEGGFGWFLIREIARDLQYVRVDNHNRVSFRLAVG